MRIGIDVRPLQNENRYRGIGQALGYTLEELAKLGRKHKFVFYIDKALPAPAVLSSFAGCRIVAIPAAKLGRKRYVRSVMRPYRRLMPSKGEVDVCLQFDASLGIPKSVPTVAFFHDLIPLLFRGQEKRQAAKGARKYKNALAGNLYWRKYLRTLDEYKKARHVLAISEASRQDYLEHVGRGQAVSVVHLGVGDSQAEARRPESALGDLEDQPYLLYVGGIDFRKNVSRLIKDFYTLKPDFPKLKLVAVGKEFRLDEQLKDLGWHRALAARPDYAKDVLTPGFVGDPELAWLYGHAEAFVFPSRYEGFGLPVLEAIQAGCPVVAYDNSSIKEVAGEAAILVKDGQPLAPALKQLLGARRFRQDLIAKGRARVKGFTWQKTAQQTLEALEAAAGD